MVNTVNCYMSMLRMMMKLAGLQPKEVEIEEGTIIHFWVNNNNNNNKKPPIILIQGFIGDGILTWQFQILSLKKNYPLYIPDLLFFGGSHTNKNERSTKFQADCIAKGLRKLGVEEKCVVVGFSYGGFVGFQMAEYYPDLVSSMVVSGSVLALSESISNKSLKRIGFSSWADYLMPTTVDGVKKLLEIGSYSLPWFPNFFYNHFLETMFNNRKERVELLEALVVKDEDVTNHQFQQRINLLWGAEEKIFNLEDANNLKKRLGDETELQLINKAGHLALLERPCAFSTSLKNMLASMNTKHKSS
ncbi:Monoacylglycerol lipase ABHD6 [Bienertia sinuspersici]